MSKIGDLFKMTTPCGDAFVHYVGKDTTFGQLVRVLNKIKDEDSNYEEEMFAIFFPVNAAIKKGFLEKIGRSDIPCKYSSPIPTKYPVSLKPTDKPSLWVVNDALGKRRVEFLNEQEQGYVLAYAVNVEELRSLFCKGWQGNKEYPF